MKSMKIITLALLLAISFSKANAQTKEETEKWIVEKLNKYMAIKQSRTFYSGVPDYEPQYTNTVKYAKTGHGWYWEKRDYNPTRYSIQEGKIEVSYNYTVKEEPSGENTYRVFKSHNKIAQIKNENITIKVDVYTIDTLISNIQVCYPNEEQYWEEKCYGYSHLLIIKLKCPCGILTNSNGKNEKVDYFFLFIDGNEEPDLLNRLQTALARLKTFYPKPKETF